MQQFHITFVTRLRLDAALYESAPPYSGRGRPRKKGRRLPTLEQILHDPATRWTNVTLPWYDGQQRNMEMVSDTAIWFHNGKPPISIRWVLIHDPQAKYKPTALVCTDPTVAPCAIPAWFVQCWQMEVTFETSRRHLGVETQRQWPENAIARTTPLLFGLFSWLTLVAHDLFAAQPSLALRQAAWYPPRFLMPWLWFGFTCGKPFRLFTHPRITLYGENPPVLI